MRAIPIADTPSHLVPLAGGTVRAGFPSPAEDYADEPLDLVAHLVRNRASTFLVRAKGDSMEGAGIQDGALLVVDRSVEAKNGSIIIAVIDGALTVKRLRQRAGKAWLEAANPKFKDIPLVGEEQVGGVVIHAIHSF